MNGQSMLRYGGLAAIAGAVLYILSLVAWMGADPNGAPPPLAATAYAVGSLLFLVTLYALYLVHRSEAQGLALAAVLLLAVSIVLSLFIDPTDLTNPVLVVLTVCYGVGTLLLGWLAYRSPRLPNGVGFLALAIGALALLMIAPMIAGAAEVADAANLIIGLLYMVWLVWLGWLFLKSSSTLAQSG